MDRLTQIIEQGEKWIESYKLMIEQPVQLKELDRFIKYSKTLPINLEQGFDLIENRYKSALSLQLKVQSFFKTNKTRGNINTSVQQVFEENMCKELLQQVKEIGVQFRDAEDLQELCDKVDKWKVQVEGLVSMPIESLIQNKEKLKNAINDARVLKLPESMFKQLSLRFEQVQWHDEAEQLWERVERHNLQSEKNNADSSLQTDRTSIREIEKVIQEGKKKGYV